MRTYYRTRSVHTPESLCAGENPRASQRGQGVNHGSRLRALHLLMVLLLMVLLHTQLGLEARGLAHHTVGLRNGQYASTSGSRG